MVVRVALLDESGREFDIGLVDDEWIVTVSIGPEVDEQYCSLGDSARPGDTAIYWEQWTSMRKSGWSHGKTPGRQSPTGARQGN